MMYGVGQKIRELRKQNKDTLKGLAEKINYDWSNLSKVERGAYAITPDLLQKIIDVYNVQPSYFFGDNREEILDEPSLKRYKFIVDGVETTEKEIAEAVRLIRFFRSGDN